MEGLPLPEPVYKGRDDYILDMLDNPLSKAINPFANAICAYFRFQSYFPLFEEEKAEIRDFLKQVEDCGKPLCWFGNSFERSIGWRR